jgi:polyadenylate-binding protein
MPGFRQQMPPMFPPFGMGGPGGAPRMPMAPQMMGANPWMSQMAAFGGMPGRPMFPPMASAMGASAGMPLGSGHAGVTSASVGGGPMSRPLGASVGGGPISSARVIPSSAGMGPGSQPATDGGAIPSSRLGAMSSAAMRESQPPLTEAVLAKTKAGERKRLIGERLFPKIQEIEPRLAGKITGMLLEMDNVELLNILEQPKELMRKINEALAVLREHQMRQSQRNSGKNPSAKQSASGKNPSVGHATT